MRPTSPPAPAKPLPVTIVTRNGIVTDDPWIDLDDETAVEDGQCAIVSLARLEAHASGLKSHECGLGVRLQSDEAAERLAPYLPQLRMVALHFPKFRDGRAYSSARLLRERLGWRGEIRAYGDVLRDQLAFMARCGFNSFALKDADPEGAVAWAFRERAVYQHAADAAIPVWRRRAAPRAD